MARNKNEKLFCISSVSMRGYQSMSYLEFRVVPRSTFTISHCNFQFIYFFVFSEPKKYTETLVKWSQSNAFVFIIRCLNSVLLYNLHALMPFVLFIYTLL